MQIVKNIYDNFPERIFRIIDSNYNTFINDAKILQAFSNRDRDELAVLGAKYYKMLKEGNEGAHIAFSLYLPDATAFYRFQNPRSYGDSLIGKRPMLEDSISNHRILKGFEMDEHGLFQSIVYPIYKNDMYMGAVEFGYCIAYFANRLKSITDIKTSLRLYKDSFNALEGNHKYPLRNEKYEIFNNDEELFKKIINMDITQNFIDFDGHIYIVINGFKLKNYQGKDIGDFIFLSERTDLKHWLYEYLLTVILISIVCFIVIYLIVKNIISPLISNVEVKYAYVNRELAQTNKYLEERIVDEVEKNREHEDFIHNQHKIADMGRMINAIAHHWRQPLNALGLYVQDISESCRSNTCTKEYLEEFETESMRMIQELSLTIDDFRKFFRSDKGDVSEFDVIYEMVSILKLMKSQLDNSFISLGISCKCKYKTFFCGDIIQNPKCDYYGTKVKGYESEFKQAILNIISNSIDAIEQYRADGHIGKGNINIHVLGEMDSVSIRISDNGGGIPDEIMHNVFEPYFSTKGEGKGTGVGLYMSKIIIENHLYGDISFTNNQDGVEFLIEIPLAKA